MFDDLYPEASEAALTAKAARPPEPQPTQRFSMWGMLSAAPKGIAAGAAQGAASGADLTKAVRDKVPANVSGPLGHIPFVNAITSAMQVGADILNPTEGQFTSEVGTSLRNVAKDYTPDPQTTHVAESAVFNLFRVGSKALTAAAAGGNIPGAVIAGAEEGFSTADDLARQGVDIKTRTKVGAVTAATNAVGFALPAAGKTWAQTGALALAGGPVSFMAQNQATREILQNADYSKLADQYDPLDPLGLALSTVLPLGFGALAMRGVKAKGPMPDGSPPPDVPPVKAPDDLVDAARVTLLRENMDATNPVRGDIAQADAHVTAYTRAMDQQANGERVQVDVPEAVAVKATQEMAARVETMRAEVAAMADEIPPQILQRNQPQAPADTAPAATKTVAVDQVFNPAALATQASDLLAGGKTAGQVIGELEAGGTKVTPELQNMLVGASEFGGRINDLVDQVKALQAQRGVNAQGFDLIAQAVDNLRTGRTVEAKAPADPLEKALSDMAVRNPNALDAEIPIDFDADGKPGTRMTVRDYLDMVKREAAQDAADADLIEVAANCFLSGGM